MMLKTDRTIHFTKNNISSYLILILFLILFLGYNIIFIDRSGLGWDEQADITISRSFINDWLVGSSIDPTQARLPMYLTAIIFFISDSTSLTLARFLNVFEAMMVCLGVFFFMKKQWGNIIALLGALFLLMNPYFISYSQKAMTESDMLVTFFMIWATYCIYTGTKKQTLGIIFLSGILSGCAIASKFTAVSILPAVYIYFFILERKKLCMPPDILKSTIFRLTAIQLTVLFFCFSLYINIVINTDLTTENSGALVLLNFIQSCIIKYEQYPRTVKFFHYILCIISFGYLSVYVFRNRQKKISLEYFVFFWTITALTSAIIIPPAHLTNPNIIGETAARLIYSNETVTFDWVVSNIFLYLACILFKSGLILGAILLLSPVYCLITIKKDPLCLFIITLSLFMFLTPLRIDYIQIFYMVPVLPFLSMCGAIFIYHISKWKFPVGVFVTILIFISIIFNHIICFPDYNLNGYQWFEGKGLKWIKRSSVGCCGIAAIHYDGVEQGLKWLNKNAEPGSVIHTYIVGGLYEEIQKEIAPNPQYILVDGRTIGNNTELQADYILSTIEYETASQLDFDYPPVNFQESGNNIYDLNILKNKFDICYSTERAFGIKVCTIWQKRKLRNTENNSLPVSKKLMGDQPSDMYSFQPQDTRSFFARHFRMSAGLTQ